MCLKSEQFKVIQQFSDSNRSNEESRTFFLMLRDKGLDSTEFHRLEYLVGSSFPKLS